MTIKEKFDNLRKYLRELGSVVVAFSSGVDSTFLLKVAHDELGDNVLAITVTSNLFPQRELEESKNFCERENIRQIILNVDELKIPDFENNPPNRCYLCKKNIFSEIKRIADEHQMFHVAEGSNMDDNGDYRPGLKAVEELQVKSPLREAKLYKEEIRTLSKELNLPTFDKPSFACLASRFVYGEKITAKKLFQVEQAEQFLIDKGFKQVRVRMHENMARIEILSDELDRLIEENLRREIVKNFKDYGFDYVTLDLQGYRTGSMNIF